jgi:hypothetical protein
MTIRRIPRVAERVFLNQPGFHGGAYVLAFVEDTSERHPELPEWCDETCGTDCIENFGPKIQLEIADCDDRIQLEFDIRSEHERANSLHKLDTLIAALRVFRKGLEEEFAEYDRREQELKELKGE